MDKELRKTWEKNNKVFYGINLLKSTDSDIIDYLDTVKQNGGSIQGTLKEALRFFLAYKDNQKTIQ
nr:hypothetical protein [uncultured Sphaerochaeta sp.]